MLHTIMLPLDGSALAEHALPTAISLARRSGATLHLVRVHDPYAANVDASRIPEVDDAIRAEEMRYIQHVVGRAGAAGVPARGVVVEGAPAPALGRYAADRRMELIVMATHGRTGLSRAWMGSVADGVMRASKIPVLLVRPGDGVADIERGPTFTGILVPLDGSPRAESVLEPAAALAEAFGASITLLEIVEPTYVVPQSLGLSWTPTEVDTERAEARAEIAEDGLRAVAGNLRARHPEIEVRTEVRAFARTAAGILERAHSSDFDLVAMTTQGRGASRVLLGSIADKVLRGTALPLLLMRPSREAGREEGLARDVVMHDDVLAGRRI